MVATNISLLQVSNFADFKDKDGAVVSVVVADLIDCADATTIYYGITGEISKNDQDRAGGFVSIAAFSNREECMLYAQDLASLRNVPLVDTTVI